MNYYICIPLVVLLDDLAAEDIYEGDPLFDSWRDTLEDWRAYELLLDLTGNLDAGGVL